MPTVASFAHTRVFEPRDASGAAKKKDAKARDQAAFEASRAREPQGSLRRLGRTHFAVFAPNGRRLVGFLVKRPDVAGMVKRPDTFCAWDRLSPCEGGLVVSGDAARDEEAIERLGIDWDRCIIWSGMDVATASGETIGRVSDVSIDRAGQVKTLMVSDGATAESLVGALPVGVELVVGVANHTVIVDDAAATRELTGGAFGLVGKGFGKAKAAAHSVGAQVASTADSALDKGSLALGKQLGKTKGMFKAFLKAYEQNSH